MQQPEWTKNNDNTWTCTYTGLPYADANGNPYTYRVTEAGLDREDMLPANAAAGPAHADSKYAPSYDPADGTAQEGKVQITNTLQEYIDIPVTKVWIDGGPDAGERPASITFVLCADGAEVNRHTVPYTLASRIADLLTGGEGEWEYTFTRDSDGGRCPATMQRAGRSSTPSGRSPSRTATRAARARRTIPTTPRRASPSATRR